MPPLNMPTGVASEYFEPQRVDAITPRVDGQVTGVTLGPPLWHGRWTLGRSISRRLSDEWRAFCARLRGQQGRFFGGDHGRPFPFAYPKGFAGLTRAGGGVFDGSATSWTVNSTRDVATLNGLPAGFDLSLGDYVMWRWTTGGDERRSLHRLVLDVEASGAGVAAVTVEPPLPTLIPAGATADFQRPVCIMALLPETRIGEKTRTLRVDGTIVAIQDLRP